MITVNRRDSPLDPVADKAMLCACTSHLPLLLLLAAVSAFAADDDSRADATARRMFLQGDYATAQAAYEALLPRLQGPERIVAVGGLTDLYREIGEYQLARQTLQQELETTPESVELWGRLAEVQFLTGDRAAAQKSAENAVRRDTDALRGRLVLAHVHRESGRLEEALDGYRWFVRYYNRKQPRDAESLRLVAEGSLEYARWKGVSSVFHFVIKTLCPDALEDDPLDWRSAVLSGDVLLEKYNEPQATPEYEAALQLNPLAAEAHAGLAMAAYQRQEADAARAHAEQALAVNPQLLPALLMLALLEIELEDVAAAQGYVDKARQSNGSDQRVLACQAMCDLLRDGLPSRIRLETLLASLRQLESVDLPDRSPFEELTLQVAGTNPKPGVYLNELGEFFDARKKYDLAQAAYQAAVDVMPQLAAARTNLGLLNMRIGKVSEAEEILNSAFKSDPFHVRVSNMRKVINVLNGYDTLRTEHFVVRVDRTDRLLGEYMAEYLDELHTELTATYGYSPSTPTQFEVYSSAQGQTAHQWFSARMVGLPWIQTIGASTGMIVALASPSAVEEPFNWGRVLRHEYVHILTLQQTDFNIPHWYTEALAVRTEGIVLNKEWKELLLRRVPAGEVYNLETINEGFRRPEGPDDWNMAYCQSRQYARFIEAEWGEAGLMNLLAAYGRGLTTEQAITEVTGLGLADFEAGYTGYLTALVGELERSVAKPEIELNSARIAWELAEDDAALSGRYAYALWKSGDDLAARRQAEDTYDLESGEPLATVVLLAFADQDGETELAAALIEEAHDPTAPHAVLLAHLAERAFNGGDVATAEEYFRIGVELFPWEDSFLQGLAVACISQEQRTKALPLMAELADRDPENITVRSHLAAEYFSAGNVDAARHWAREVLFLDLENPRAHFLLGRCWLAQQNWVKCREELDRALEFDAELVDAEVELVRCDLGEEKRAAAIERLERVLRNHPEHAAAQQLQQELQSEQN